MDSLSDSSTASWTFPATDFQKHDTFVEFKDVNTLNEWIDFAFHRKMFWKRGWNPTVNLMLNLKEDKEQRYLYNKNTNQR